MFQEHPTPRIQLIDDHSISMGSSTIEVEVGVHQGSALSPFVFATDMDHLTEEVRREAPWNMLFADDVVLVNETRGSGRGARKVEGSTGK